jgi:hypothetical protein
MRHLKRHSDLYRKQRHNVKMHMIGIILEIDVSTLELKRQVD